MIRRTFFKAIAAGLAGLGLGLSAKENPPQGEPILHDDRRHFVGYGWGNLDPVSKTALLWSCRNKTMTFGHQWSANIHVSNPRV